jgi:hypothetical protein
MSVHIAQYSVVADETPESAMRQHVKRKRLISPNYF